jgi:cytochrome c oxidase cbb3-type subunit 1
MSETHANQPSSTGASARLADADIDASCRLPLQVLFISAAVWGVIASLLALIASIKLHGPALLANQDWLTYGRIWPASMNAFLYGFCVQAGLGVSLWLLARLGRNPICGELPITTGAALWNLGVTAGVLGILSGGSTGFEYLEMPRYASVIMFVGYLLIGIWSVITFHRRHERELYVSQWFIFAALFWFPWIFSTAELLLVRWPVRGIAQAVVGWWYAENLLVVWFGLVGLGAVFYFLPKLINCQLASRGMALATFWLLILIGGWGGIPNIAPVPAWMPTLSILASVLMLLPLLILALNVRATLACNYSLLKNNLAHLYIGYGLVALFAAGLLKAGGALLDVNQTLYLTWFTQGRVDLLFYGFYGMIMIGSIYYITPRLVGLEFGSAGLVTANFWCAAVGGLIIVLSLILAGITEALKLQDSANVFLDIFKATLPFLRLSTVGNLLLLLGHFILLGNLIALAVRYYRARAAAIYSTVTMPLKHAEVKA